MTTDSSVQTAIVLLAHGSRDSLWRQPIEAVAERVRQINPGQVVCCAYIELCPPDLPSAVDILVTQGALAVRIVPLFLGLGKHVRQDLPVLLAHLQERYPMVTFSLQAHVGEHASLIDLIARMALSEQS